MSATHIPIQLAINVPAPEPVSTSLPRSEVEALGLAFVIALAAAAFVIWIRFFVPDEDPSPAPQEVIAEKRTRRSRQGR